MPGPEDREREAAQLAVAHTQDYRDSGEAPPRAPAPVASGWAAAFVGRTVGSYRIVRPLGRGGMGVVFEAVHESIGGSAAVKILSPVLSANPQLVQRFWSEARAISRVPHPGLVRIFDFGQMEDGTLYILMERLLGETLRDRLDRGRLGSSEALRLGRQVAAALAAAHEQGIAHRDLKPDNVFIVADDEAVGGERAKVLDFGLAKVLDATEAGAAAHPTGSGMIMGTPAYMAPEQCRGLGQADEQADVYALGVMLFEILSGKTPFIAEAPGDLLAMHMSRPAPPLLAPGAPAEVARLIADMLRKDPATRPAMARVALLLGQLDGHNSGAARPARTTTPSVRATRARWRGALLAAAVLIALAAVAGLGLRARPTAAVRPAESAQAVAVPAAPAAAPAAPAAPLPTQESQPTASAPLPRPMRARKPEPRPAHGPARQAADSTPATMSVPLAPRPEREDDDVVVPAVR